MVEYKGNISEDLKLDELQNADFVEVYKSIDSTNIRMRAYLESLNPDQCCQRFHGFVCADQQTAGRGRYQRPWWSPAGKNTYTSFGFSLPESQELYGLSLAVGLALRETIMEMTGLHNLAIKWPNDLYASDTKLAGILIEAFQSHGYWQIVVGIGVNVNQTQLDPEVYIGQPWTSIALETESEVHRGQFITQLCKNLQRCFVHFESFGWSGFQEQWREADWLYGRQLVVQGNSIIRGKALGVDQQGLLKVKDDQGVVHFILSGEISVRVI